MLTLFVLLLILKLAGVIHWSWWLITLPIWFDIAVALVFFAGASITGITWGVGKGAFYILGYVFGVILSYPIRAWDRKQNKRIAEVYEARELSADKNVSRNKLTK